jgi:ATP-dependent DNA helicase RecG
MVTFMSRTQDRSNMKTIAQLAPGEMATVIASVSSAKLSGFRRRNLGMFEARFSDASRAILVGKWFHGGYLAKVLGAGMKVALFGKVEFDTYSGELTMLHPEFEILSDDEGDATLHVGRLVPIYEAVSKLTTRLLRVFMHRILETLPPLDDPLPEHLRARFKLPDRATAIRDVHFPPPDSDLRLLNAFRSPAQFRLIFEEFFWLECGVALKRSKARTVTGIAFEIDERVRQRVKQMLPFKPTGAQKRVIQEIAADMRQPHPMNRLLQGDVGSGKTIVAAEAAVIAIENGYQVAVLAPTEILAAQHAFYFRQILSPLGYSTALLTGSFTSREKDKLKQLVSAGLAQVVVGTHALLEKDVEFHRLGLAIIDEQHRFGVLQRLQLVQKGAQPDVLVMTATPIPRTLAMTLYGDLDVSVIDELPPGRKPIVHQARDRRPCRAGLQLPQAPDRGGPPGLRGLPRDRRIRDAGHEGRAADVRAPVARGLPRSRRRPDARPPERRRKGRRNAALQGGPVQILVSTTVIEVGMDVPNASVMLVEQAERFGLAQLHQLRGRVGRGAAQSYCILVTEKMNDTARERIRTLVDSTDGFHISEIDLKLRGPGEFFGTKQSGLPALRVANILRDAEILEIARREAVDFVARPPSEEDLRAPSSTSATIGSDVTAW